MAYQKFHSPKKTAKRGSVTVSIDSLTNRGKNVTRGRFYLNTAMVEECGLKNYVSIEVYVDEMAKTIAFWPQPVRLPDSLVLREDHKNSRFMQLYSTSLALKAQKLGYPTNTPITYTLTEEGLIVLDNSSTVGSKQSRE